MDQDRRHLMQRFAPRVRGGWRAPMAAVLSAGLLVVSMAASALADHVNARSAARVDRAEDCLEAVPEETSLSGITDDGKRVSLEVLVLLDAVPLERGQQVMAKAAEAYAPLNIDLRSRFAEVTLPSEKVVQGEATSSHGFLMKQVKTLAGGARPADVDVVYLLTGQEIDGPVAGFADCIGGVRYPNRAFAIGEEDPDFREWTVNILLWASAKIAAHEVGHLMGAHHHYANCAEGSPTAAANREVAPCTTMFNDIGLLSLRFSTLEGAAIRGHALAFAADTPPAMPEHPRVVSLRLVDHLAVKGTVDAAGMHGCTDEQTVEVQRQGAAGWSVVATVETGATETFEGKLPDRAGKYRAVVRESRALGERGTERCLEAVSPAISHRH